MCALIWTAKSLIEELDKLVSIRYQLLIRTEGGKRAADGRVALVVRLARVSIPS